MPDRGRPRVRRPQRADLTKRGFHFVDHELLTCHIASPCVSNPLRLPRFIPYLLTYRVTSPKHRVTGNPVAMALPRPIQLTRDEMKTTLTDRGIKALRKSARAYDVHDAVVPGLTLNVLPSGLRRFVLLTRFPGAKHATRRALGAYGALTLEAARTKARQWLELIARGIDPANEAQRARREQERRQRTTFAAMVEDYIASAVIGANPDQPRHRNPPRILNSLRDVLVPLFGKRPVTELTADDLMPPLELIGRIGSDR